MILTLDNLHIYLLEKGCLSNQSIVQGGYTATQSRTRNTTFNVTRKDGQDLFVKQLTMFDHANTYILQKDATCLWLIKNEAAFSKLSKYVPDYIGYDADHQVLITEFLSDARNLEMFFRVEGGNTINYMEEIAEILASYHFPLDDELQNLPSMRFFSRQVPWAMNTGVANRGTAPTHSPVSKAVASSPDFQKMLQDARDLYEYKTLIHGDIKWMNFLAHGEPGKEQIKLIDWEIADIGDPLWDVGGIVMSLVTMAAAESPYQKKDMSQFPAHNPAQALEECWPVFGRFWRKYWSLVKDQYSDEQAALNKAIHFGGARLIQTAIEFNMAESQLNANSSRLLQSCIALFSHRPQILQSIQNSLVPA